MRYTRMIGILYRQLLKPILFLRRPETMHTLFGKVGHYLWSRKRSKALTRRLFHYEHPSLQQQVAWLSFSNPVWLAAGFDKDILLPDIMGDVGFGFVEVGSITYLPYEWNPGPRLHRLKKSQGLVVNYGLKNKWIEYAVQRLQKYGHLNEPTFVSIAKTNCVQTCDVDEGISDYCKSLLRLSAEHLGSAYVLNISCPNAFGGEDFASPALLRKLLDAVNEIRERETMAPVFIKLPVDKSRADIEALLAICVEYQITWVVISNLTKKRETIIEKNDIRDIPWGISGKPVFEKSNLLIHNAYQHYGEKLVIVGVGGIFSAADAYEKIKHGATLVQLITGMIYQWPQLIGEINKGLVELLMRDGYTHISQAVGAYHKTSK